MDNFTFNYYERIFQEALSNNYNVITLKAFFLGEYDPEDKVLVNRIDVDIKIDRLSKIYEIFNRVGIKASIYLRVHSAYYNLFSVGNIQIVKKLIDIGCEIGLHTELEDMKGYCDVNKKQLLIKEIELFEEIFNIKLYGTTSHGDMTHYNNLNFWKTNNPSSFGLIYEGYDEALWNNCTYVSDSEWVRWKTYQNGKLLENDRRTPIEHIRNGNKVLYLLTHPESWYERYIHE
jgi:hypothetical protein